MNSRFDVIIIGGGASGLMCAVRAKQNKPRLKVAIIEKNDRVGKKLLATGNGRCNLTHSNIGSEKYTGSFKAQSESVFRRYGTERLLAEFEKLGLLTCRDGEGRYYPLSKQAGSVLDVLRFACEREGVEIFCGESIRSLKKEGGGFKIKTASNSFFSDKLVIACGSKAAPKLGGSSSGADYLKNLGHSVIRFSPALCPLRVGSPLLKPLKGIRAGGSVTLCRNGRMIKSEKGEIQFAENALSGICVFNLSLYAQSGDEIIIDLLPDISEKELSFILRKNKGLFSTLPADNLLTGVLQKRLAQSVMKKSGKADFSALCGEIVGDELKKTASEIKRFGFKVEDTAGFDQAQCAKGGVLGREIDEKTMSSRVCKNLYVCGEAVDLCGECGGYNLHFAFASGMTAGESL